MDKNNMNYNNFYGYSPYSNPQNEFEQEFNPLAQYEQGYMYYKFLTQQLEYKIKYREFEKMNNDMRDNRNERRVG